MVESTTNMQYSAVKPLSPQPSDNRQRQSQQMQMDINKKPQFKQIVRNASTKNPNINLNSYNDIMSKQEIIKPPEQQPANSTAADTATEDIPMEFEPMGHEENKELKQKKIQNLPFGEGTPQTRPYSHSQTGRSSRQMMETQPLVQEQNQITRTDSNTFKGRFFQFFKDLGNDDSNSSQDKQQQQSGAQSARQASQSQMLPKNRSNSQTSQQQQLTSQQQKDVIYESNLHRFKHIIYSKSRKILSLKEKERVYYFLKDPYHFVLKKPSHHRYTWLKCSGAYNAMLNNPGYYEELKNASYMYPNPSIDQIEVDLRRTYPFDPQEKVDQYIVPLRNVLITYVRRNPSGMYCQGMNSIAARLLCCMSEEEAFWTFAQIVECYLPLDYYSNLLGVLIDQKVMAYLIQKNLPKAWAHFEQWEFNADLQIFKWLVQLFVGHLDTETEYVVWDLFFIKGTQVIFRVALTVMEWLEPDILACDNFGEFYHLISKKPLQLDRKTLLERLNQNVSNVEIRNLRMKYKKETIKELRDTFTKNLLQQQQRQTSYPQMQFIQKFYLYRGLSQYFREQAPNDKKAIEYAKLMGLPMDKYEKSLMKIFDCKPEWPICLYILFVKFLNKSNN